MASVFNFPSAAHPQVFRNRPPSPVPTKACGLKNSQNLIVSVFLHFRNVFFSILNMFCENRARQASGTFRRRSGMFGRVRARSGGSGGSGAFGRRSGAFGRCSGAFGRCSALFGHVRALFSGTFGCSGLVWARKHSNSPTFVVYHAFAAKSYCFQGFFMKNAVSTKKQTCVSSTGHFLRFCGFASCRGEF